MAANDVPEGTKIESVVSSNGISLRRYLRGMYRINVALYISRIVPIIPEPSDSNTIMLH